MHGRGVTSVRAGVRGSDRVMVGCPPSRPARGPAAGLWGAAAPPVAGYPVDPNWAPPRTVYIPETGQTVDQLFLDLWLSGGGAISWGNPITPEIEEEDGQIVQYYEYARFEYWPEGDEQGNYVTLGEIGRELGPPLLVRRFAARGTKV